MRRFLRAFSLDQVDKPQAEHDFAALRVVVRRRGRSRTSVRTIRSVESRRRLATSAAAENAMNTAGLIAGGFSVS